MGKYLSVLLGVGIISAIVKVISPEGALKKHIEFLCSVCVLAALVLPAAQALSGISEIADIFDIERPETQNYEEIYNSYILDKGSEQAELLLSEKLCEELSVSEGGVRIKLIYEYADGNPRLNGARAIISASGIGVDPERIREYVRDQLSVECEIIYDIFDE